MKKGIISLTPATITADRKHVTAKVQYPDLGIITTTPWQGSSTPGYPGPVMYQAQSGTWHRVERPERFGDTFGHAWLENFYR